MMKKALSFILSLCLLLSLFSGCSRQTEVTTQASAGDKPSENVINGQNNTNSILVHDGSLYDVSFSDFELDASYSESGATKIRLNGTGADFTVSADGDGFHSVTAIQTLGGSFVINSKDDGFHSDASVMVNGGNINIESCYEGIEGKDVFINDGTIYIISTDDALNAAGGSSDAAAAGPRGGSMGGTGNTLTVNGGYVCIKTGGDGIDINGSGYINGGTVIVSGPQESGNASIDYDGQFEVSGGTLIVAGSSRMAQVPSKSSTVYTVACNTETQPAGTLVHIEDADGNNIVTFAPCVDYSFVSVTSPLLEKGGTYKFALGGSAEGDCLDGLYENPVYTAGGDMTELTLTDTVTYIGGSGIEQGGNGFAGPRGNKGGMPMPGGETRPEKPEDNKFKGSKPQ